MSEYKGYTEEQGKRNRAYKAKSMKRIPLDVQISEYEAIKAYAEEHGETINGFLRRLARETTGWTMEQKERNKEWCFPEGGGQSDPA